MQFKHSRGEQQRLLEIDQELKYLEMCDDENVGYFGTLIIIYSIRCF